MATGSMLTAMAKGKSIEDALMIDEKTLLDALDGLPDENLHCATLGVHTLRKAIEDYMKHEVRIIENEGDVIDLPKVEGEENI